MEDNQMKEEILKLKHGEKFIVPESDYGKAEIWLINDIYILFEIPMFGGGPSFFDTFTNKQIDVMIDIISNWI